MNTIAKSATALAMAGALMAPQAANGESILRTRHSDASGFQRFLPALPSDVPWLTTAAQPARGHLPEAGSVAALMLAPQPAENWGALMSQPAALRPAW